MSELDRFKWDRRYREDVRDRRDPVDLLQRWLPRLPRGRALDVACGAGRNAILLARSGYRVDAIDISAEGLRLAREQAAQYDVSVNWIEHDLDTDFEFARDYDLIVVLWYVNLPLITRLADYLSPGGCLLCEEHLQTGEAVIGPDSSRFRVAPGALRAAMAGLEILHERESVETTPEGERLASAQIVARRTA